MLRILVICAMCCGICFSAVTEKRKVLIVGAGPAGIAAASKLMPEGFDVQILEAEDRIGGRVMSVKFGNAFVDLGAEWCHGEKDNIIYEFMKEFNVLKGVEFPDTFYLSNGSVFDKNIGQVSMNEIFKKNYYEHIDPEEGTSLGQYFIKHVNAALVEKFGKGSYEQQAALLLLEGVKRGILSSEGAFSWFSPSAKSDFEVSEGNFQLSWDGKGYKTILDFLMKKFPKLDESFKLEEKIMLGKQVENIKLNNNMLEVICTDKSTHKADHVIFTPSLGVLKHYHESLFTPNLDDDKIYAIKNLGFDAVLKVMTHFEERWWPEEQIGFSMVWTFEDRTTLPAEFSKGPLKCDNSWLSNLMGAFRVEQNPNVLSVWFTGEFVPEIEKMPEHVLIDGLTFAFDKFFGHKFNITKIDQILSNHWYSNEHFHGTYSYQTIESRKQQNPSSNQILSRPVNDSNGTPRLLFAGEATNPIHYSTVHGAIETGFREAYRIIDLYKND